MQLKHLNSLRISALLVSAIALSACGSEDITDTPDTGIIAKDPDTGDNTGDPDAGINDDGTGPADDGVAPPPMGPCPENYPGCRCTPEEDTMDAGVVLQGTCVDPNTVCAALDDTLAVCLQECEMDTDCSGTLIGNPQDNRAAPLCRGGICVEAEAPDDEGCRLHALGGRELTECRQDATCIRFADDAPGEGTCAQQCTPTPADPNGGCNDPAFPFCNPSVLQGADGNPIGICSPGRKPVGARCGGGLTGNCDTSNPNSTNFCFTNSILDPNGQDPTFFTLGIEEGFCIEQCDPSIALGNQCDGTSDDGAGPGQCLDLGMTMNGPLGLCSNECSEIDDTCTSTGSLGAGSSCFAMPGLTVDMVAFGQIDFCRDVLTPVVAETPVVSKAQQPRPAPGATPEDCLGTAEDGEVYRCAAGTACLNLGSQMAPVPGCARLCAASSTAAVAPFNTGSCGRSSADAVCIPFAGTGTTTPVGFCAPTP